MPSHGLSPLARGTRLHIYTYTLNRRFIPAGAGNTRFRLNRKISTPVYPRWRGEHNTDPLYGFCEHGLSPLARGTLGNHLPDLRAVRFIPAGAGNTPRQKCLFPRRSVYPRWRGEHHGPDGSNNFTAGLSPLARGTPKRKCQYCQNHRFIPAGAGNTDVAGAPYGAHTVYPRWRGEHTKHTYLFLNNFIPHQQSTN